MIKLTVENLTNGNQRVTSRVDGRTVRYLDRPALTAADCFDVLRSAAWAHETAPNVFNMEHIELNDAAKQLIA